MKVYKLKMIGDTKDYWLTPSVALPIMKRWENAERGTFTLATYGVMADLSRIKEIRAFEEHEPYPDEFKKMLVDEGTMALPDVDSTLEHIKTLPTTSVVLDTNFEIVDLTERQVHQAWLRGDKRYEEYYNATVHYTEGANGKELYIKPTNYIKELVRMRFDPKNPEYKASVTKLEKYGVVPYGFFGGANE